MTKAVLEAESGGAAQWIAATVPTSALAIPASLQASLMARLDRLGSAKEVAQIGAVIGRDFTHALLTAVARKPEGEVDTALERLIQAGLLSRQGVPPYANYLFKHALVQDAAYGTLLREPRRALHARVAETIETQFSEIAETQPELLARHCTEAGLIEKAAGLWGNAARRSVERSALVEAIEQFRRAIAQIDELPGTPVLRREQFQFQVAMLTPLGHLKGFAAPETKAAVERARLLLEQAEMLGDPPLRLSSILFASWVATYNAFDGDMLRELAAQYLALAEKQGAKLALMIGHRVMGISLLTTGDIRQGLAHLDQAIALYDPAAHRQLAARLGMDSRTCALSERSCAQWILGHPEAALADAEYALKEAREIGHPPTLMDALTFTSSTHIFCGNYAEATAQAGELIALADEEGSVLWKPGGTKFKGYVLVLTGKFAEGVEIVNSGMAAYRSTGGTYARPTDFSILGRAYAALGQFDDAWRCVGEAMTTIESAKERWFEAEANRIAGEIALLEPKRDTAKAEAYFERALAVARAQQAKSWELRAAMSMARLWCDQGKRDEARALLAPVYGWFTEGFDTLDLKEAKALLDELAA